MILEFRSASRFTRSVFDTSSIERRNMSETEELEKLCKPVADWLKKNHDPHTEVHITIDHIDLVVGVIVIPVEGK